jgi:hypothetical protein
MNARIHPDRALTAAEKARRHREGRAAYVRALERAVSDATWMSPAIWDEMHGPTIRRAVAATDQG